MNDLDLQQVDKETIELLNSHLESAYAQIRDLGHVIYTQDILITKLKERFKAHGIHILEKSIVETTKEELAKINKSIPAVRTRKAFGERAKFPTYEEQKEIYEQSTNGNDKLTFFVKSLTDGVDLEKHGIDPETLNFKPGYGPNGKISPRLTLWQKMLGLFKLG